MLSITDLGANAGVARYALRGALTIESAAAAFVEGLAELAKLARGGRCDFDCSGIDGGDSTGLAVLIEWKAESHRRGLQLSYANLPASLTRLARLSDVDSLLITA